MTVMEPRFAQRRKLVSEDRARKRLKWVLSAIVVVGVVVGLAWLIRSPLLSIREVEVLGAERSDPMGFVAGLHMDLGTPTIDVHAGEIEAAVLSDPWVESADVKIVWPGSVFIEVVERTPVAPVLSGATWMLVGRNGGVIKAVSDVSLEGPRIAIDLASLSPGDAIVDPAVLGAIEFVAHLSDASAAGATIRLDGAGLVATVGGHNVRLGRPIEMAEKATVLEALLATGLAPGTSIDLVAPLRPTVTNPQPQVEAEE